MFESLFKDVFDVVEFGYDHLAKTSSKAMI
jgi:hypothetical protein